MAGTGLSVPVLFVSSHAKAGGAEGYLATLAENLGPDWVKFVVCLEDGPLVERLSADGVPVEVLPTSRHSWGIVGSARRLRRLLAREQPAVVHANGIKAALVSVLATRRPIVWAKHDFSYDGRLARFVAGRCALVVGVSEAVTKTFADRSRIEVVHNGLAPGVVDRQAGRQRLEEALGGAPGAVVALVGRLDPVKGHRELLAAASEIRGRRPDLRLVFVGGPDASHPGYEEELRREAGDEASFLGHRDDARELIAGAELLAIPTVVPEGFPYVGLEALAAGTPVVGYASGGLPELVGPCGLLVPPGDRDALAEAIVSLLEDESRRRRLGECGRERVAREFTLDRMVEATRNVYLRAAAIRSRSEARSS